MRLLLAFILVTFVVTSCAIISGSKETTGGQKKSGSVPSKISASLLPTLVVGVNSCYVFLRPDEDSDFFGPLVKGETVKRIDVTKYWILVWIPRLRISGWVRKNQVYAAKQTAPEEDSIPADQLIILNVVKSRVNVRKAPTTRSRIIFKVKQRQEYAVLDAKKGWYQIWLPQIKRKGWISGKMVVRQRKR
jgi:uncharacterized protein YgiM (DUF1202 family)